MAQNPREWDNLGTLVGFHRNYSFSDSDQELDFDTDAYNSFDELAQKTFKKDYIYLNVYMYEHGNIALSTSPFSCRWDSGQLGFIYVSKEKILKEFGGKIVTKQLKEKVLRILEGEIKLMNKYVSGETYGYSIADKEGEEIDNLWGFYGYDHEESGLLSEARNAIDYQFKKYGEQLEMVI